MREESLSSKPILVLVGPTAVGKTAMALIIAEQFKCEIVSVDSMQVYRFMDIGTAKASQEERTRIRHHLIDIINPDEQYDAARFAIDAKAAIADIQSRNKLPLVTGGTGLYLKALLHGIFECLPADPEIRQLLHQRMADEGSEKLYRELLSFDPISASRININDRQRLIRALEIFFITGIPWSSHLEKQRNARCAEDDRNILQIGLTCERSLLYQRINQRSRLMIDCGLEHEVHGILARGYRKDLPTMQSIGYRHMLHYIDKIWTMDEMIDKLARDTRRYAKRQYTWFNSNQFIHWYGPGEEEEICRHISLWLK